MREAERAQREAEELVARQQMKEAKILERQQAKLLQAEERARRAAEQERQVAEQRELERLKREEKAELKRQKQQAKQVWSCMPPGAYKYTHTRRHVHLYTRVRTGRLVPRTQTLSYSYTTLPVRPSHPTIGARANLGAGEVVRGGAGEDEGKGRREEEEKGT